MPLISMLASVALADPNSNSTFLVAARNLPPGTVLHADDLYEVALPLVLAGEPSLRSADQAIGRILGEPVLEGEVVREERFVSPEAGAGPSALVPRGQRLVRLALPEPSDLVAPWSWVDVLRIREDEACFLAEQVHVIAAEDGQGSVTSDGSRPFVAAALHLAVEPGAAGPIGATAPAELAFVLRNSIDKGSFEDRPRCDEPRPQVTTGQGSISGKSVSAARETLRPNQSWMGPSSGTLLLVVTKGSGSIEVGTHKTEVAPGSTLSISLPADITFQGQESLEFVQIVEPPQ